MEEANAWRNPVDLVALLDDAFAQLPDALAAGAHADGWAAREALVDQVLGENPAASINALLTSLREGASDVELASAVSYAAVTRIARFRRRTSSATGTRPCTPSPSPTRSSRAFAVRLHRSSSAACSTLR